MSSAGHGAFRSPQDDFLTAAPLCGGWTPDFGDGCPSSMCVDLEVPGQTQHSLVPAETILPPPPHSSLPCFFLTGAWPSKPEFASFAALFNALLLSFCFLCDAPPAVARCGSPSSLALPAQIRGAFRYTLPCSNLYFRPPATSSGKYTHNLIKAAMDDETLSVRLYSSTPLSIFLLSHNAHGRCLTAHETVHKVL